MGNSINKIKEKEEEKKRVKQENQKIYEKICQLVGEKNISSEKLSLIYTNGIPGNYTKHFPKLLNKFGKWKDENATIKLMNLLQGLSRDFLVELKLKEEGELENVNGGKKSILETIEILSRTNKSGDLTAILRVPTASTLSKPATLSLPKREESLLKRALKLHNLLQPTIRELDSFSLPYLCAKFAPPGDGGGSQGEDTFFRKIIIDSQRLEIDDSEQYLTDNNVVDQRRKLYRNLFVLFTAELAKIAAKIDDNSDCANCPFHPDNYGYKLFIVNKCVDTLIFSTFVLGAKMCLEKWFTHPDAARDTRFETCANQYKRILPLIYKLVEIGGPRIATIFSHSTKVGAGRIIDKVQYLEPLKVEAAVQKWKSRRQEIIDQLSVYFLNDISCIIFDLL